MAAAQFSVIKTYYETEILRLQTGDPFIGTTRENQLINEAYEKTAYSHDWPQLLVLDADIVVANLDRYTLPSNFRKMDFMFVQGALHEETDLIHLPFTPHRYAIALDTSEYIINTAPTTASTAYTLDNAETAGNAVVIDLDTVDGLAAGEDIWVDGTTTNEFTRVQSVDTANVTITARLANNQSSGDILYRVKDVVYFGYYKTVTALSADADASTLPDSCDLVIPHYAAYLYYRDQRNKEAADYHFEIWDSEIKLAWLAFDKGSTGYS